MAVVLRPKKQTPTIIVPDGTYKATLSKVTQFENAFGERVGFEFTLHGEGVNGIKIQRTTNSILTPKSKLHEIVTGLLGRDLTQQEKDQGINAEALVGTACRVFVVKAKSKSGEYYSNIERVLA